MWSFLLSAEMAPFSGALALVVGLVCLELVALMVGGSLMGAGSDGPDIDGPDLGAEIDAELDMDSGGAIGDGVIGGDVGEADLYADAEAATGAAGAGGVLGWIGLADAPFVLWLAGVAAAFGLAGYGLQLGATSLFGAALPVALAAPLAAAPGLLGGKLFASAIARITPKTETSAVSRRRLGGRRGVITQGTAARDRPAECRVSDSYGNLQYIRVEPLKDGVIIPQGTDVVVLKPKNGIYPVIALGEN